MTIADAFPKGGAVPVRGRGRAVEPVIASLVTGVLTLVGVLVSNSKSRAVMEQKIEALTRQVEKHNCLIERTFNLERDMAVARNDIDTLKEERQ